MKLHPDIRVLAGGAPIPWTDRFGGGEDVSMNLWGFHPRMLDHLDHALHAFDPARGGHTELLLPDVIGQLLDWSADVVQVARTESRCVEVTYPGDLEAVRDEIARETTGIDGSRVARSG